MLPLYMAGLWAYVLTPFGVISVEEVRDAVTATLQSIQRAEYSWACYVDAQHFPSKGCVLNERGHALAFEIDCGWDRFGQREYWQGRIASNQNDEQTVFQSIHYAFDGRQLKTLRVEDRSGAIKPNNSLFGNFRNPLQLAGFRIAFSDNQCLDLDELIAEAKLIPSSSPRTVALESKFKEQFGAMRLRVVLDPSQGWLPQSIRIYREPLNGLFREIVCERAVQVAPDLWCPVEGTVTYFVLGSRELPADLDEGTLSELSEHELDDAFERTKTVALPLGIGPMRYVIDESTLRVNQEIPDSKFTFEFPPGTSYFDEIKNEPFFIPPVRKNWVSTVGGKAWW